MARGRLPRPDLPEAPLNYYGLERLGYDEFPLTGDRTTDQLSIEFICFRIGHTVAEGGLGKEGHFHQITDLLWNNPKLGSSKRYIPNDWSRRIIKEASQNDELGIVGCTSSGKSDVAALWGLVNFIADPTHTLVLLFSTTLAGAKKRIFKTFREYYSSVPGLPGKPLWSTNEVKGPNYEFTEFGDSSGIFLLASEQSSERSAVEKLIGIKTPKTGEPDESFDSLVNLPEFADMARHFDLDTLRELLPRLQNLAHDRIGKLILIVDEATGCAPSILEAYRMNLKPGNAGHCQLIMLGNPASRFDTLGEFCKPVGGWDTVSLIDMEWETATGGLCIRFDGEQNPRITQKNEKLNWMLRQEDIDLMKRTYGENSAYYWRMARGMWAVSSEDSGVYSESDIISSGATEKAVWGFQTPVLLASLDPSFAAGGDKASCTFGKFGKDPSGMQVLEVVEEINIPYDLNLKEIPINYQLVRNWKKECEKRGIRPENAVFDSTGGGGPFGDIIRMEWSPRVLAVSSGGKAAKVPINEKSPDGRQMLASERFFNKATELWMGAMPFLRSRQIKGMATPLSKQICSRQYDKSGAKDARMLRIEGKRIFRGREGKSPDESDSFFLLIELAKTRLGFKPAEKAAEPEKARGNGAGTWKAFCEKARRHTSQRRLT